MAIYKTDDGSYVISSGGMWLPGAYADSRTARYAYKFPDAELIKLRDDVHPGLIRFEHLQQLFQQLKK